MNLKQVDIRDSITPDQFKKEYYGKKPLVLKNLSANWAARRRWDWEFLKTAVGPVEVGVFSNDKNKENKPVHTPHTFTTFDKYIDSITLDDQKFRLFLFNILDYAPSLIKDFEWPTQFFNGVVRRYPMLFAGAKGSVTHLHFDMDLSDVMQTQFLGKKRVLLFPFEEQYHIYRRPFEVMSLVDFTEYYTAEFQEKIERYPALKNAKGYEVILEHGDTLYMPSKFWHHMEYIESGIGLSLRSWQPTLSGKLNGLYHIMVMRKIDSFLKLTAPESWYNYKLKRIRKKELEVLSSGT
jgi:ribosomal protein L16 Arg81 hydroxylase